MVSARCTDMDDHHWAPQKAWTRHDCSITGQWREHLKKCRLYKAQYVSTFSYLSRFCIKYCLSLSMSIMSFNFIILPNKSWFKALNLIKAQIIAHFCHLSYLDSFTQFSLFFQRDRTFLNLAEVQSNSVFLSSWEFSVLNHIFPPFSLWKYWKQFWHIWNEFSVLNLNFLSFSLWNYFKRFWHIWMPSSEIVLAYLISVSRKD